MSGLSFRRIFPKGLYARSALLSLVPILVVLALMTIYYFNGHLRTINTKLSQNLARQVSLVQETCRRDAGNVSLKASFERRLNIRYECDFEADPAEPLQTVDFFYSQLVREQMQSALGEETEIYSHEDGRQLDIRAPLTGSVLQVIVDRKRAVDINGHIFIVWVAVISLIMIFTALAFLRNHVRSILRLTEAAQAFGRGQGVEDFRPSGAREVRAAANAVIEMRDRLTGFAEQRTMMLAGVSHDLRTPLARLQLHLAMQEQGEETLKARADIRDMEAMLDEYLAFARGEDSEQARTIDLRALVSELVDPFPGARLVDADKQPVLVTARPVALKRAIANLLANATTYGEMAEIKVHQAKREAQVIVDDNGPGIPEADYDAAFRPFARLNEARTQNRPGVGLGLALAQDTARSHGGSVTLHRSPLGGLRACLSLPV